LGDSLFAIYSVHHVDKEFYAKAIMMPTTSVMKFLNVLTVALSCPTVYSSAEQVFCVLTGNGGKEKLQNITTFSSLITKLIFPDVSFVFPLTCFRSLTFPIILQNSVSGIQLRYSHDLITFLIASWFF
jgi:hypothetical protein